MRAIWCSLAVLLAAAAAHAADTPAPSKPAPSKPDWAFPATDKVQPPPKDHGELRLRTKRRGIEKAQALYRKYAAKGRDPVADLIAERRRWADS